MIRNTFIVLGFLMLSLSSRAFFVPLTTEQRTVSSSLIAVVEITGVDAEKGRRTATVIQSVMGSKVGDKIEIWDDWQTDKNGVESRMEGRDPYVQVGKRYWVYLAINKKGRLVTVQSSLDCLQVVGEKVEKENGDGFETLSDKIEMTRAIVAKRKKPE